MTLQAITIIFTVLMNQYNAAKILGVFPTPSISHQVVFRSLTVELSKRGHEVVVITADPAFKDGITLPNLKEIDIHNMSYTKWAKVYEVTLTEDDSIAALIKPALSVMNDIIEEQFKIPAVQKLIKEQKFDLVLLEAVVEPILVYAHLFNAPVIQVSSFGFADFNINAIGASWHPILYPHALNQKIYNLSNWEKIRILWDQYRMQNMFKENQELINDLLSRTFGTNTPTIKELNNKIDMLFLNIHPLWDSNRPVPPNAIYIWGIHEKPAKELSKDLKNYLDSSKNGVIYISFGTNVKTSLLPLHKVQIMVKVFSELPYDILWKWDKDELSGRTENIRISKWLPQSDLLRHPNIKVFVTQGGIQSTGEAITGGVPLIGIPMLADQWYNAEQYVIHKIGVKLDMTTLEENQLKNAIETIIKDPSYRENMISLRDVMHDQPMTPLQRAVWWTEYVLRHGGAPHLRTPAANISWKEYIELDLVLIILSVILVVIAIIFTIIYIIYQYCKSFSPRKKVKNN